MKTFVFEHNYDINLPFPVRTWYFLADSALTNAGKPFFIPDFAKKFEAIPVIAIKIARLGKSIAPRFGSRYYSEFAPAIHFRARDLMDKLETLRLPADRAYSFDRSFIMGEFLPFPTDKLIKINMMKNGEIEGGFDRDKMLTAIDEVIAEASEANTLKMGDLIVPALPEGISIEIGDTLELTVEDRTVLTVQIK